MQGKYVCVYERSHSELYDSAEDILLQYAYKLSLTIYSFLVIINSGDLLRRIGLSIVDTQQYRC